MSVAGKGVWILIPSLFAAVLPTRAAGAPAVEIRILARSVAPGEAVRILVDSKDSLASLGGTFADQPLFFLRHEPEAPARGREVWSAWSLVDLGVKPGSRQVEVIGRTVPGRRVHATRTIRVLRKEFPTQRLEVESRYVTPPPEAEARISRERELLAAVYATRSVLRPLSSPFLPPVPGDSTSTFGARRILNGVPKDPHPGIDLPAGEGTPVKTAGPGRVALAADLYYSGVTVIVDHGGGLFTVYAHLSRIDVKEEDWVDRGQLVGLSGATGRVTGPHLHWGAKVGDRPLDPTSLLDAALYPAR